MLLRQPRFPFSCDALRCISALSLSPCPDLTLLHRVTHLQVYTLLGVFPSVLHLYSVVLTLQTQQFYFNFVNSNFQICHCKHLSGRRFYQLAIYLLCIGLPVYVEHLYNLRQYSTSALEKSPLTQNFC